VFHSLRPFDATNWHVKNAETSDLIGASQLFFVTFGLPVLFLLAGAGVQFALRRRSWQTFLRERMARLLVPFVVGTLLLSPIQAFIEATQDGIATGSMPDFPGWWVGAIDTIASDAPAPTVFGLGYHLWFLGFLFAFSVIGLPLFAVLRKPRWTAATRARRARGEPARIDARVRGAEHRSHLRVRPVRIRRARLGGFGWYFALPRRLLCSSPTSGFSPRFAAICR
jgi:hypothetical protein